MSSSNRAGDSRLVFGTTDETWGYVQSFDVSKEPETKGATNGQGNVVAVEYFNKQKKVKGTYYYQTGATGDPFSVVGDGTSITMADGTVARIEKASKGRQVGNWCVINFDGVEYPDLVNS